MLTIIYTVITTEMTCLYFEYVCVLKDLLENLNKNLNLISYFFESKVYMFIYYL